MIIIPNNQGFCKTNVLRNKVPISVSSSSLFFEVGAKVWIWSTVSQFFLMNTEHLPVVQEKKKKGLNLRKNGNDGYESDEVDRYSASPLFYTNQ